MTEKMERRSFLAGSLAAAYAIGSSAATTTAGEAKGPETSDKPVFYELRLYHLLRGPMIKRIEDYSSNALLPALARRGMGPVGVFSVAIGPDNPTYYVLIPHATIESAVTLPFSLAADAEYRKAAATFSNVPATDPPYTSMETRLLVASDFMPHIEPPAGAAKKEPRILELRTYRSHSKAALRKKLEMFGPGGELAIFRRVGLQPVFFAENLFGPAQPNLTYMLVFPDLATREKNWNTFIADPEWKKLSTTPGFTDPEIVAQIDNVILRPAPHSQI